MANDVSAPLFSDAVLQQKAQIPAIYGNFDFGTLPERFTTAPDAETQIPSRLSEYRQRVLADSERVALIRNYTMTGDRVADAYAALIPEYGFRTLVEMLDKACDEGIDAVQNAPDELVTFIRSMEDTPDWVDMSMIERGARQERNLMANVSPYVIRGAFIATFMNKYSALPMMMTGTLSQSTSAKRVLETASFFTATTLPGALGRFGGGFKAAAKVRLMHSMVRFNIMRSGKWDQKTYGIPIPQVDQMPAGLIGVFLMSFRILNEGRNEFTEHERCMVELSRYRCFLLGLPQDLLGDTPQEIADLMLTRNATLRSEFDNETCGELVRGTMAADLSKDGSVGGRLHTWMERGFAKVYFIRNFCEGDLERAREIGVTLTVNDKIAAACAAAVIVPKTAAFKLLLRLPIIGDIADRMIVRKVESLLDSYGHADFITDSSQYQPVAAKAA
jgi:hypothetical protein